MRCAKGDFRRARVAEENRLEVRFGSAGGRAAQEAERGLPRSEKIHLGYVPLAALEIFEISTGPVISFEINPLYHMFSATVSNSLHSFSDVMSSFWGRMNLIGPYCTNRIVSSCRA